MYKLEYEDEAKEDVLRLIKSGDKKVVKKLDTLLAELQMHPRKGTGRPEPLKYKSVETWSRQITEKHRLVYEIYDEIVTVIVLNTYGHYGDK